MAEADHMSRITEQQLSELQAKHGRIKHVSYNGVDIVFRKPRRVEVQQHRAKLHTDDPNEKSIADEQLAILTVEYCNGKAGPDSKQALNALADDFPYLFAEKSIGDAIAVLSGIKQDETLKNSGSASQANATPSTDTPKA